MTKNKRQKASGLFYVVLTVPKGPCQPRAKKLYLSLWGSGGIPHIDFTPKRYNALAFGEETSAKKAIRAYRVLNKGTPLTVEESV